MSHQFQLIVMRQSDQDLDHRPGHSRRRFLSLVTGASAGTVASCGTSPAEPRRTATRAAPVSAPRPAPRPRPFRPAGPAPTIYGRSAMVVDVNSGETLFAKAADTRRAVASTQKLLTALVVIESGGLNDTVTVAASDTWVEPTKIGLKAGQRYRKFDLVAALLVRSGNDVARCLGRDHSGSQEAFAAAMNAKARRLGMRQSNFCNPHGLTEAGQLSTARDMSKVALAAYRSRTVRSITSLKTLPFRFADGRTITLKNTNKVLERSPYCNGLKTGYTRAAGRCLISSGRNGNREVVVVVLGSNTTNIWDDSKALLHWGLGA